MNPFHQHIPTKGRHIKAAEDRGTPQILLPACLHIQQGQLGVQIVIKQFFIMIILQQVGISQHRRFLGSRLLDHRPHRSPRRRGWVTALFGDGLANQTLAVRQPLKGAASGRIELHLWKGFDLAIFRFAHMQDHRCPVVLQKSEVLSIWRPYRQAKSPAARG